LGSFERFRRDDMAGGISNRSGGDQMQRRTILIIAACLAICAGIAPLVAIAYLSQTRATQAEQQHLAEYAQWTLRRANITLTEAEDALRQLKGAHGCTPAHIARMRRLTIDARSVDEIGHYQGGRLTCTSWGPVQSVIPQNEPHERLANGLGLYLHVKPRITRGGEMLVLSDGAHNALIQPQRMVDVLLDSHMTIGVATGQGRLIALSGKADPRLVERLTRTAASGTDERHLFAVAKTPNFVAFAISDQSAVQDHLGHELRLLIPVGLFVSAILIGVVAWVSRDRLSPQKELARAIRRREFVVHYQPIIELSTDLCVGAEALIRWPRPDGKWIHPDGFLSLAEETGLIAGITDLLIDRVVEDLAQMLTAERSVHIAINIAACDMESGRFLPVLKAALARSDVAPSQIWLEATERGFMDADAARRTIDAARAEGHMVAVDDFGTGYSSLSLLETLPLDALKIDQSFVAAIGKDTATSIVTPHIIDMAHSLKFNIVAEGVETAEQEEYLRKAGVEFVQGWLYAKALPADAFIAYYRQRNGGKVSPFLKFAQ
jgi:sensor c-di-GMP phosphodiesterase-like protein